MISKPHRRIPEGPVDEATRTFADTIRGPMQQAVRDAVAEHHRAGRPVVIWRDGQIVWLYPDGSVKPVGPD